MLIILSMLILSSCVSKKEFVRLEDELKNERLTCNEKIAALEGQLATVNNELRATENDLLVSTTELDYERSKNRSLEEQLEYFKQTNTDLLARLSDLSVVSKTGAESIQKSLETLREQNFDQMVGSLALGGRIVVMAGREARPPFPVGPFYVKDCKMFGFAMFNAAAEQQQKAADDINRWMAEGKLAAQIGREMPLAETAAAHRLQEENTLQKCGTLAGKIVLVP